MEPSLPGKPQAYEGLGYYPETEILTLEGLYENYWLHVFTFTTISLYSHRPGTGE